MKTNNHNLNILTNNNNEYLKNVLKQIPSMTKLNGHAYVAGMLEEAINIFLQKNEK